MGDPRLPRIVYVFLLAIGVLGWAQRYPQLPERMASHFGANGQASNWQSKEAFFLTMAAVVGISFVVTFVVPLLITVLPASMVNLPHKEYWLAAERRKETSRYLSMKMGWFGCGLLFLHLFATSEAINANLPSPRPFNSQAMWMVVSGFLLFVGVWMILLLRHFYRPRE